MTEFCPMQHGLEHAPKIQQWLNLATYITIIPHQRADGDAIGSALGLYHYLLSKGKKPKVVSPTDYPYNLKFLPDTDRVLITPFAEERALDIISKADLIFCLDFGDIDRCEPLATAVLAADAPKIMIDHHIDPKGFDDVRVWDVEASSTCELVYRLIDAFGDAQNLSREAATCLYTGLLTDTGGFRFPTTTPAVHNMAASLLAQGAVPDEVHERLFSDYLESRLRVMGDAFSEGLHILPEYKTAYVVLQETTFTKMKVNSGDTEGLVNFVLGIKGVNFAAIITPQTEPTKITKFSFRSRNGFPCNEFAAEFSGGGHAAAAGGKSKESIEVAEQQFLAALEKWKPQLLQAKVRA